MDQWTGQLITVLKLVEITITYIVIKDFYKMAEDQGFNSLKSIIRKGEK